MKPEKRCKVWKLKQAETKTIFSERVRARAVLSLGMLKSMEGYEGLFSGGSCGCVWGNTGIARQRRLGGGIRRLQPWRSSGY